MKTPITPLRMPLELKERAKRQAKKQGKTLSAYIFDSLEFRVESDETYNP